MHYVDGVVVVSCGWCNRISYVVIAPISNRINKSALYWDMYGIFESLQH